MANPFAKKAPPFGKKSQADAAKGDKPNPFAKEGKAPPFGKKTAKR